MVQDRSDVTAADRRPLGSVTVGPLAYGCWRFVNASVADARALIETALDAGMDLIDTADVYGLDWGGSGFGAAEELLGKVLADAPSLRDRMVLATKAGIRPPVPYDSSDTYLRSACEDSLRRLGVDHVELFQIHRPDVFTHPGALAATLAALHAEGKIGAVGVSNHTVAQTEALLAHLRDDVALVSTQPQFSAADLTPMLDGTLDLCERIGITPLAWSPLAGGALAGGDGAGIRPELTATLDDLAAAAGAGVDRAAVALAFVLHHPARPVAIIGSQRPERIRAAAAALQVRLERADLYRIIEASTGEPLP